MRHDAVDQFLESSARAALRRSDKQILLSSSPECGEHDSMGA
jgi:hypothetical protein